MLRTTEHHSRTTPTPPPLERGRTATNQGGSRGPTLESPLRVGRAPRKEGRKVSLPEPNGKVSGFKVPQILLPISLSLPQPPNSSWPDGRKGLLFWFQKKKKKERWPFFTFHYPGLHPQSLNSQPRNKTIFLQTGYLKGRGRTAKLNWGQTGTNSSPRGEEASAQARAWCDRWRPGWAPHVPAGAGDTDRGSQEGGMAGRLRTSTPQEAGGPRRAPPPRARVSWLAPRPVRPAGAQKPQSWGRPEPPGPRTPPGQPQALQPPRPEPDCFFPVRRSGGGGARRGRRGGRTSPRPECPGPRGGRGGGRTWGKTRLEAVARKGGVFRTAGAILPAFLPAPSSSGGLSRRLQVCIWGVELRGRKTRPFPLLPRLLILSRGEALPSSGPFSALLSEHSLGALSSADGPPPAPASISLPFLRKC